MELDNKTINSRIRILESELEDTSSKYERGKILDEISDLRRLKDRTQMVTEKREPKEIYEIKKEGDKFKVEKKSSLFYSFIKKLFQIIKK